MLRWLVLLLMLAALFGGDAPARPLLSIDGEVLHANTLEIAGITVRDVLCRPRLHGSRLRFEALEARAYGGLIKGHYAIDLWDEVGRQRSQEVHLEVTGIDLRTLLHSVGAASDTIDGRLYGRVELTLPVGPGSWSGRGEIDIRDASLVHLPFLVNLLAGSPTAARRQDRLQAHFLIAGDAIRLTWLALDSPAIQLSAHGRIGFDGTLDILVVPRLPFEMIRHLPLIGNLLAGGLGWLTSTVTQAVIRGHIRQPVIVFNTLAR